MPIYCYKSKDGNFVHRLHSMTEFPRSIRVKGKRFHKQFICQHGRTSVGGTHGEWPIHFESVAVLPNQIAEAREHCRRSGVPTSFDSDGCPIITDPGHKKKFLKAWDCHDNNSYG